MKTAAAAVVVLGSLVGCTPAVHDHSPATRPAVATEIDPARGQPAFWLAQEPALAVTDADLDRLWDTAEHVSQRYLFEIDRRDRRAGLMTTVPSVSPQWFEPWRTELQSSADVAQSSIATVRRTIFWSFARDGERYQMTPKVLIERQALAEQRISGLLGRGYFQRRVEGGANAVYGTRETDRNIQLPESYWYSVGRDFAFEQKLIERVRGHLAEIAAK